MKVIVIFNFLWFASVLASSPEGMDYFKSHSKLRLLIINGIVSFFYDSNVEHSLRQILHNNVKAVWCLG